MFTTRFQQWVRRSAQAIAGGLGRLPVTPNQVTVAGMLVIFAAGALVATGQLLAGGIVLAFGGSFDILDGALARARGRTNPFGAFLDSTTDRYAEAAIYIGLATYYAGRPGAQLAILGVLLAVVGSFSVSYVRARAQSLGYTCDGGFFARPERIVAIIAGLVLGGWVLLAIVWALALLTNLTALQRVREVWLQARAEPVPVITEAAPAAAAAEPAVAAPAVATAGVATARPRAAKQKLSRQPEA